MPTLFEAAETGNIKLLVELATEGADVQQANSDGNTPLMLASYAGHVEIVEWLVRHAKARTTEQNASGNTALLLACAYGRLDIVKFLLREQGVKALTQKNAQGVTPLLIAAHHQQLTIFDFLIRSYYLTTPLVSEEKKALSAFPKDSIFQYYLAVLDNFSQETPNLKKLASTIYKAETYLNPEELSYVYFIHFWILVTQKAEYSGLTSKTDILAINRLQPNHQTELLKYMFQEGYLVIDSAIRDGQLHMSSFNVRAYRERIENSLARHTRDANWIASSASEKSELFRKYYALPLYCNLVSAYFTGTLEGALNDPFGYVGLDTHDPHIADWVAYHLSLEADVGLQDFLNAFTHMRGASRTIFFETVKKYLTNDIHSKAAILNALENAPDKDGTRLLWSREYPRWLASLRHNLGTLNPSNATLSLIGLDRSISLAESFSEQIWDMQQHRPQNSQFPGNHPVYKMTLPEQQEIYCKLYPGLPGINDAAQLLYRRLFGATGGVPWSATGMLEIDNQVIPVLISQDGGELIKPNDSNLDLLDKTTLAKLILFTMLTNPEDGKTGNFALRKNASDQYELCSFDNDQSFVGAMTETGIFFKSKKIRLKSFLFCLDAMKDALDDRAVKEFLSLEPLLCLESWLQDLCLLETQYENLFKHCKTRAREEKDLLRRSYLDMVLPAATLMKLAYKMDRLQQKLHENPKASGIELLSSVEPEAGQFYGLILQQPLSPTERFEKLAQDYALYKWCSKTSQYSTTLTSCKEIFEGLVPDNQAGLVTPRDALAILQRATQQWQVLAQEQVQFTSGNVQSLFSMPLDEQQRLLKFTRLNQFTADEREKLFDALSDRKDFKHLHIEYPHTSLTFKILAKILKNNAELENLSIRRASALTEMPAVGHLKALKKLVLRELPLKTLIFEENLEISELILKANTDLARVSLKAPNLRRLRIIDCPKLEKLELALSEDLDDVVIESCLNLPLGKFFQDWPGFISQWHSIPSDLRGELAVFITTYFKERDKKPKKSIYEAVGTYLEHLHFLYRVVPDIKNRNEFGLAIQFLELDYTNFVKAKDYVRVVFEESVYDAVAETVRIFHIRELVVEQILFLNQSFSLGEKQHEFLNRLNELIKQTSIVWLTFVSRLLNSDGSALTYRPFFTDLLYKMNTFHKAVTERLFEIISEDDAKPSKSLDSMYDQMRAMQRELKFVVRAQFIEKVCRIQDSEAWFIQYIVKVISNDHDYSLQYRSAVIQSCKHLRFKYQKICEILQQLSESADEHIKIIAKEALVCQQRLESNDAHVQSFFEEAPSSSEALTQRNSKNSFQEALKLIDNYTSPLRLFRTIQNLTELGDDKVMRRISVIALAACKIQLGEVLEPMFDALFADKHESEDAFSEEYESETRPSESSNSMQIPPVALSYEADIRIVNQTPIAEAAFRGDITAFKKLCEDKNAQKQVKLKNSEGDTPLSLAARSSHFLVADYLIRHYYHDFSFTSTEIQAIGTMRANPQYEPYAKLVELFSASSVRHDEIVGLLRRAENYCTPEVLSTTYLLYLWREVSIKANANGYQHTQETYPIPMQRLSAEHQLEMIDHMIREGYALKDWYIHSEKLSVSNMTMDKKQVQVMRRLLEQGQYQWRLMSQNLLIEEGLIYLGLHEDGLRYALLDSERRVQTGVIPAHIVGHALTTPFTLEQLPTKAHLLEYISKHCNTRTLLRSLIVQGVRFTKMYEISLKGTVILPHNLYCEDSGSFIKYTVMNPSGKIVTGRFSKSELQQLGWQPPLHEELLLFSLKPLLSKLLIITAQRGHTRPEKNTKGYSEFLRFLGSALCCSNLRVLHLDDCDLSSGTDTLFLYRVLEQCRALTHLSLDKNHINTSSFNILIDSLRFANGLRTLSVCYNEIEITNKQTFLSATSDTLHLANVFVTGNLIAGNVSVGPNNYSYKLNHKRRYEVMKMLFRVIAAQGHQLTVRQFWTVKNVELNPNAKGAYLLGLSFSDGRTIELTLTEVEHRKFVGLAYEITNNEEERKTTETKPYQMFGQLVMGVVLEPTLLNTVISENKELCKKLLYHHPNGPLKGLLPYHSVFKAPAIQTAPSFLFPSMHITFEPNRRGQGMVYLMANKVGLLDPNEHAWLGYEYLNSYGQHIFKIAHLKTNEKRDRIWIEFLKYPRSVLASFARHRLSIAPFCVNSHDLKKMHTNILQDVVGNTSLNAGYQTMVFGSSQKPGVLNCLIYVLDKTQKILNLGVSLGATDCRPSTLVKRFHTNFELAEAGLLDIEHSPVSESILVNNM